MGIECIYLKEEFETVPELVCELVPTDTLVKNVYE